MKKLFILALVSVFCFLQIRAENIEDGARRFRTNIQNFLREEGFAPYIDNDGSLCFKKEGEDYWIDFSDNQPVYVRFCRKPLGAEDAEPLITLAAINDVNTSIRALKCFYVGNQVAMEIESYCYLPEDFRYVFYDYLYILSKASDSLKDSYSKIEQDLNSSSNSNKSSGNRNFSNSSNGSSNGNTIYINGPILDSQYHKWWATSITLNSNNTIVNKVVSPKTTDTYVCGTKDEYIEDCDTGKKYYITASSIGMEPQYTILKTKETKSFYDTYPALPYSVKRINIWSGDDYYIKNLQIR